MITAEPIRKVEAKTKSEIATGADVVVETLEAQGVTHVFGVPGAKIDKVFDRLRDSKIKTVVCRHEQNAAFIAGGIGRMTGKAVPRRTARTGSVRCDSVRSGTICGAPEHNGSVR